MNKREHGFTLVEIMIVVAIIALLAAIAIPNVLRGRTSANESAAIGNMRALISSAEMFRSTQQSYPGTGTWNADMYNGVNVPEPNFGPPSFDKTMNGGNTAAGGLVQGYVYNYVPTPAACATANCTGYNITAIPQTNQRTGTRSFFVDESGVIRHCTAASGATNTSQTIDVAPNSTCP